MKYHGRYLCLRITRWHIMFAIDTGGHITYGDDA